MKGRELRLRRGDLLVEGRHVRPLRRDGQQQACEADDDAEDDEPDDAEQLLLRLQLHDFVPVIVAVIENCTTFFVPSTVTRSEEHTSELQSHVNLVCRLLLEKKKKTKR